MTQGQPHLQGTHSSPRGIKNSEEEPLRQNKALNALGHPSRERLHHGGNQRTLSGKSPIGNRPWKKALGSPQNPSESTCKDSKTTRFYNMSHSIIGNESPSQNLRERQYSVNLSKNFRSPLSKPISPLSYNYRCCCWQETGCSMTSGGKNSKDPRRGDCDLVRWFIHDAKPKEFPSWFPSFSSPSFLP